tara:strand:+ start:611 stop:1009 length:399 start_codon:yes stop_codon:yes gene_type:complete
MTPPTHRRKISKSMAEKLFIEEPIRFSKVKIIYEVIRSTENIFAIILNSKVQNNSIYNNCIATRITYFEIISFLLNRIKINNIIKAKPCEKLNKFVIPISNKIEVMRPINKERVNKVLGKYGFSIFVDFCQV